MLTKKRIDFMYIHLTEEAAKRLMNGETVVGGMRLDREALELYFNDFKHTHGKKSKDRLVKKLEHGSVKESKQRYKVFTSIPKELGVKRIGDVLESEMKSAMDGIVDNEIINLI